MRDSEVLLSGDETHDPFLLLPWQLQGLAVGETGGAGAELRFEVQVVESTHQTPTRKKWTSFSRHSSTLQLLVLVSEWVNQTREKLLYLQLRRCVAEKRKRRERAVCRVQLLAFFFKPKKKTLSNKSKTAGRFSDTGAMFKKSKSKVLVDYASEEDDMSWHYHHSYKVRGRMEGEVSPCFTFNESKWGLVKTTGAKMGEKIVRSSQMWLMFRLIRTRL